jgi:hypothetical protein
MLSQLIYLASILTIFVLPANAGNVTAPELDASTLGSLAAAFTGSYAAFRVYKLKRK